MGPYSKLINVIQHINKKKNHMVFSIDAEKAVDKLQHPFLIKILSKLGTEGHFRNLIKGDYKNRKTRLLGASKLSIVYMQIRLFGLFPSVCYCEQCCKESHYQESRSLITTSCISSLLLLELL